MRGRSSSWQPEPYHGGGIFLQQVGQVTINIATDGAPSSEALQSALNVIEARAHFDGPERVVHLRVGGLDGRLYLDLCDELWRAIEIDACGWRMVDRPLVRFRRAAGMQALPVHVSDGSVDRLASNRLWQKERIVESI
jgi:hypothetical protein